MPISIMWNYDGNNNPESHKVFMADDTGDNLVYTNLSYIYGVGRTYKEALSNYIKELDKALVGILEFRKSLNGPCSQYDIVLVDKKRHVEEQWCFYKRCEKL